VTRARNKVPGTVVMEGSTFFFHGLAPAGISQSIPVGARDWGEYLRVKGDSGLLVPRLDAGGHAVGVDNRRDGDGTRREGGTLLDVARWRWDEVGAALRGARRGGGRASRVDAENWRCRRCRGRRKQGRRGCRGWWRRGPRLNGRRGDGRRRARNRCGRRSRLGS
jgi:hypothetical protein